MQNKILLHIRFLKNNIFKFMVQNITKDYEIDFGTTYSCIAHINKNREPAVIRNTEGDDKNIKTGFFMKL